MFGSEVIVLLSETDLPHGQVRGIKKRILERSEVKEGDWTNKTTHRFMSFQTFKDQNATALTSI